MTINAMSAFRVEYDICRDVMLEAALAQPERVWNPRELRSIAGGGCAAMTALCDLCNSEHDGRLELTDDLNVTVPR